MRDDRSVKESTRSIERKRFRRPSAHAPRFRGDQMKTALAILVLFSVPAFSEIASLTVAAKVMSFDGKTVVLDSNGHVFKVKRGVIHEKSIHEGDVLIVSVSEKSDIAAVIENETKR